MKNLTSRMVALVAGLALLRAVTAQPYNYDSSPSPVLNDLKSLGVPRFDSYNRNLRTPQGGTVQMRSQLQASATLHVRTAASAATFANGSARVTIASHGLSVNDPVVLSVLPNTGTATVTIASPGVFTKAAHGYAAGQPLRFDTTGALPTGLTAGGTVYVITAGLAADTFRVSLTPGGAAINTTGSQSGTHYISQAGAMPTFSTAGLLVQGAVYYVKTVVDANSVTLSTTAGGTALGTATVAAGLPVYSISTGNDANDGSAADRAHALLTLQHAVDLVTRSYDLGSGPAIVTTVQAAQGTYREDLTLLAQAGSSASYLPNSDPYYNAVRIFGDLANASNVTIAVADGSTWANVSASGGSWYLNGLTLADHPNNGLSVTGNAYVELGNQVNFTAPGTGNLIYVQDGGFLRFSNDLTLIARGNAYGFFGMSTGARADMFLNNLVLLNAPHYSAGFANLGAFSNVQWLVGGSVDGTATGPQKQLAQNSTLYAWNFSGLLDMPGDSPGTIEPGSVFNTSLGATATNDNAYAGTVGEFVSSYVASGVAVSLTNNTAANVTSVSLTPGDWDVEGNVNFAGTAATVTAGSGGISVTGATLPTDGSEVADGTLTTVATDVSGIALPRKRVSVASTTTVYLVARKSFSAGSVAAYGGITARRVR